MTVAKINADEIKNTFCVIEQVGSVEIIVKNPKKHETHNTIQ